MLVCPLTRLLIRFNDERGYRPAKVAHINYENEDYFDITWAATDEVKIDYKFVGSVRSQAMEY
jgi:hypothetical protein